jgi:YD repeat-containing protein
LDRWHTYEYDKNGNLVKKTEAHGGRIYTYVYDYENRLTEVEIQSGDRVEIVAFRYDPFGRRISKSVGSEEIVLLVLAPALVAASEVLYVAGGVYLSWVAGSSIGCMISCSINPCNY